MPGAGQLGGRMTTDHRRSLIISSEVLVLLKVTRNRHAPYIALHKGGFIESLCMGEAE